MVYASPTPAVAARAWGTVLRCAILGSGAFPVAAARADDAGRGATPAGGPVERSEPALDLGAGHGGDVASGEVHLRDAGVQAVRAQAAQTIGVARWRGRSVVHPRAAAAAH